MTIGQRIAQKRKEQGLSQEALGDNLGVTRQSISKWEGDVTLPEIDKLIALSRLFGVSVGWLLGEEQEERENPSGEETPPPPEELSETQLHMVEEIVQRYIAAQPKPPVKKRRLVRLGAAIAVLCFALVIFNLSRQIKRMEEQNQHLQQAVNNVTYSVNSQIYGITNRVEEVLKAQNDLTADFGVEQTGIDLRENTLSLYAHVLPKVYEQGMIASFLLDNGVETLTAEGQLTEGRVFEARLTCELTDEINVYVLFRRGGVEERQLIGQFSGMYTETIPEMEIGNDEGFRNAAFQDGTLNIPEQYIFVHPYPSTGSAAKAKEVRLGLFKNHHLVEWCEPTGIPDNYYGFEDCFFFLMKERSVAIAPGDNICFAIVATDEYDRTTVRFGELWEYEYFSEEGTTSAISSVEVGYYQYDRLEDWSLTKEFVERSPAHRP